ncbi:meiotic recombination protein W68 [Apis mellifera]|uniref:DNA topoisomerase (ATP-hydrolyzing) n=1 Tax=Apis mellifera TaxID=7460 RepID=A0A7M7MQI7_APIME|nr:meiotic recombination protein W68 [Apis mellifera]|eukprot:XP_026299488.1 meiotic recombination protein W68 [Apis mellifera]
MNRNMRMKVSSDIIDQLENVEEKKIDLPVINNTELRKQLIARIEDVTLTVIEQISSGRLPQISYSLPRNYARTDVEMIENDPESQFHEEKPERNVEETEGNGTRRVTQDFASKRGKDKFALMMTVMATAHRLLITNTTLTRRSLYYDLKNENTSNLVPEQRCLDQAVHHVANLLNCAPWDLSEYWGKILILFYSCLYFSLKILSDRLDLLPTSKGLVAGELTLTLADNRVIDCTVPGGALIPHLVSNVISARSRARLVLIVEKDSVFQKLLEDDCTSSLNCILVTGKGYPDVATRMLVKLLSEKLELPVYIIVDADPFGIDIMCVYRFGSAALSRERESLACSNVRWLGVHPSELLALGVNTAPLTEFDLSKLTALEGRPYTTAAFLGELGVMRKLGKAEIENVSSSRKFLVSTYLPCKIKGNDYV